MENRIEVVGAVIVNAGKILCMQRSAVMKMPLLWEFPGGKVKMGESFSEALVREIKEELDCRIEVGMQIARTSHIQKEATIILNTFYCTLMKGNPKLIEHQDMCWLTPSELQNLSWAPADIPTVEALVCANGFALKA